MPGKIPQTFIDDLLTRVDIVDLIESRVSLKKAGKDYQACCPFHAEKTPSFTVSRQKQFYYCFGCGATGSAIRFLMDYDNMEFVEAVEELAKSVGMDVPYEQGRKTESHRPASNINYYELMGKVANYYQFQLRHHESRHIAVDYLKQRGLSGEIAKQFELGFSPSGWDNLFASLAKNDALKKALVEMGMLVPKDNGQAYDRFRNRIMFPIRDRRGRVIAFGGRVIDANDTPKYLNSPETPIFHKNQELYGLYQVLKRPGTHSQAIVVEGYMDVVALAQAGIDNAVATLGTAVSENHIQTLIKHFDEVIFCFDGDAAGHKAALRALETSLPHVNKAVSCRFMFLPQDEDPDSVVKAGGAEAFLEKVEDAIPLSDFLINELLSKADYRSLDGQARLVELAKPYFHRIPRGSFVQLIGSELAKYINLDAKKLLDQIYSNAKAKTDSQTTVREKRSGEKPSTIRLAIAMLLHQPSLASLVPGPEKLLNLKTVGVKFLVELLVFIQNNPNISTGAILEHWHATPHGKHLYQLLGWEHHVPESGFETEFLGSINLLQRQLLEQELNDLIQRSKKAGLSSTEKQRMNDLIGLCQAVGH